MNDTDTHRTSSGRSTSTRSSRKNESVETSREPIPVDPGQEFLFPPPRMYHAPEVCERAGVTYRQLDYWCRRGYVRPVRPAHGSGSQREFDEQEVRVARAVKVLLPVLGPRDEAEFAALLDRVRRGVGGLWSPTRGIWYDLDELTADPE